MVVAQESARRAHRRRRAQARRQRGRCRGRGRLCDGGDLSARRQYRRRRLHGDPSRQRADRAVRHRLSRDARRPRPRATCSSTPRAKPTRRSRAISGSAIGVPGTVAGLALAHAEIRLRQIHARAADRAGDRARARRHSGRGRLRRHAAVRATIAARAGRRRAKIFLQPDGTRARAAATVLVQPISPTRSTRSPSSGPRAFYEGADRRQDRRRGARRRRPDDQRRSQELPRGRAAAGARHLSRLRHRLDAAAVVRRRAADRDAQRAGRLQARARRSRPRCI